MRKAALLLTFFAVLGSPCRASGAVDAVADAYKAAVEAQDFAKMGELLTEDSVYQDFTMEYFDRDAIDLKGREAILDFWRSGAEASGTSEIRMEVRKRFTAGPTVIFDMWIDVRVSGHFWDVPQDEIVLSGTHIMFLRIEDGKVTHHVDHVDYGEVMRQVEELRKPTAQ